MPHSLLLHDEVFDVRYAGRVSYAERAEVMQDVVKLADSLGMSAPRVLSDFSEATPYEEGPGARADFIAAVITSPWLEGSRVALVKLPDELAQPAKQASVIQGPLVQTFANREDALDWLRRE